VFGGGKNPHDAKLLSSLTPRFRGVCARDETLGEDEVVCLLGRVIADSQAAQLFGQLAVFEVRGYRRRGRSDHYSVPATVPSTFATPDRHENVYRLENNTIGLANNVRLP